MKQVIPEGITNNGWQFFDKCNCGGIVKQKFKNPSKPGMLLEWWVHYYKFRIIEGSKTKVALTKIGDVGNVLRTI